MRVSRLVVSLLCALPAVLAAQGKTPRRPQLPGAADTNSALAYYRFALGALEKDPRGAADALYWANRLNPGWAAALYAQRIALLRADDRILVRYLDGDNRAVRDFAAGDSLYLRSRLIDPFLHTDLDRALLRHYLVAYYMDQYSRSGGNSRDPEVRYWIEEQIRLTLGSEAGISHQAWEAFSDGRFGDAVALYSKQLGKNKKKNAEIREDRATAYFLLQRFDSAAADLREAIAQRTQQDVKEKVVLYRPKALLQHKLGLALTRQGDLAGAREAFGKALEEDLAFYPAHLILANMALAAGDTATAFREYDLAIELSPSEPVPHITRGKALLAARRYEPAAEAFRKVTALEPWFAAGFFDLARALAAKGDSAGAIAGYQAFLARTTRDDSNRNVAQTHIRELGGTVAEGSR